MSNELRIFSDVEATNPISIVEFTRTEVGTTKTKTVWMKNISKDWPIEEIDVEPNDKQITYDYPKTLEKDTVKKVIITWKPSLSRREVLDVEDIFTGELLIG